VREIFLIAELHQERSMANHSDHSDGESGSERAHPRRGPPNAPSRMEAGVSPSPIPASGRVASYATAPLQFDAPRAKSRAMTTAGADATQLGAEARGRTAQRRPPARSRLSRACIPPAEELASARLLRHLPLRAGTGTLDWEWLDELASLVQRVAPGPKG
jgi:hypothetical protein